MDIRTATLSIVKDLGNLCPMEEKIRHIFRESSVAFQALGMTNEAVMQMEQETLDHLHMWRELNPDKANDVLDDNVFHVISDKMVKLIQDLSGEDVERIPAVDIDVATGKAVRITDNLEYKVIAFEHMFRGNFAPYIVSVEDIDNILNEINNANTQFDPNDHRAWVYATPWHNPAI
jgi:DNA-directed RNA polymerase subunit F